MKNHILHQSPESPGEPDGEIPECGVRRWPARIRSTRVDEVREEHGDLRLDV